MTGYLLTDAAEQDIDAIKLYLLAKGGPPLVQQVLEKIEASMQLLAARPVAGHSRTDLTNEPVKFWQVFSYFVIYDPVPQPIHIVRVLHTSRDIATIL